MRLTRTRKTFPLMALNLAIMLIVGGGAAAYASMSNSVTLTVDGRSDTIRTFGSSVSQVLDARDIDVDAKDKVSLPDDHQLQDGDDVTVAYAKPVTLSMDGEITKHTVYNKTVGGAIDDLGLDLPAGSYVSQDADQALSRDANALVVSTKKQIKVTADGDTKTVATAEPTVQGALDAAGITVGDDDEVTPGISMYLAPDTKVKVVRVKTETKTETVKVDYDTTVTDDPESPKGEVEVVSEGVPGENAEKVEIVYADGKVRERKVLSTQVVKKPVAQVEKHGTEETTGDSVWDKIAQCESGGNWSINTGNGYYGGLQFSAATWRSVGGPGLPHQNSREVQIKYAKILQARSGWGQWGCAGARFN